MLQNLVGRGKRFRILLIFLLLGVLRNLVDGEKKSEFQRLFFVIKSFAEFSRWSKEKNRILEIFFVIKSVADFGNWMKKI